MWYDEVISFWIANPNLSFQETINFNKLIDINTPYIIFNPKIFFSIFGYSVETGRLFSVILSSLSILSVGYLSWCVTKKIIPFY